MGVRRAEADHVAGKGEVENLPATIGHSPVETDGARLDVINMQLHVPLRIDLLFRKIGFACRMQQDAFEDRTIDGLVARLRRKLEPENERPRLIKTVRGVGYAFGVDVKRL